MLHQGFAGERLIGCIACVGSFGISSFEVRYPIETSELEAPIRYKIIAKNLKPVERTITLKDKLVAPKS
jgi:hypothetical protein